MIGRSVELGFIDEAGRRDGPAGVVVAGVAGVGKTRIAREALGAAKRRGALTRWVVATVSAQALPLGAFAATLRIIGADPTRLVQQAADALVAGAGRAGVVVGVDDAHLLDDLSAVLVHQLALNRAATLVLTVRTGEVAPDAVTALWKDGHLRRLELQPLSEREVAALGEAVLGGQVDNATTSRLWRISQGNVLYLRHLVDGELEAGRLHQRAGVWRWRGQSQLSAGLVELIQARIGRLSDAEREVIQVLVLGEPLGTQLLVGVTDPAMVEQVEARGLVRVERSGRRLEARLAHPLYGEVERQRMGQLRACRLRGRIAQALADTGARRADDTLHRGVLTLDSDLPPDRVLLGEAARRAVELLDIPLGERLARAALAAGGGFEPRLTLGYALTWSGRGAEAETELAQLETLAETDAERVQAAIPRIGNLFWTLALPAQGEAVFAAVASTITDEAARLELTAMRTVLDAWLARPVQAAAAATEVLANPRSSSQAVIWAAWGLLMARGALGRVLGLEEIWQRANALPVSVHTAYIRAGLVQMWLRAQRLVGLLDAADHTARDYLDRYGHTSGLGHSVTSALYGQVLLHRGQVSAAVRWLRQARAALKGVDPGDQIFVIELWLTFAMGMAGDAAAARQALADLEAARHPAFVFMEPEVLLAHAWVAAAEGALSQAIELARNAATLAESQNQLAMEVIALHTAVCFGDRTPADRLAELTTQVDGPRGPVAAAHAAALIADNGAALLAASVQWEQMGALLLAADAAAQAAAAHHRHRQRAAALSATARAHRLAQTCEGARTPALIAIAAPLPLTHREREITTLAANGLSNQEIAQRLQVSVRTVENHLYRASAKLGSSNRAEFAALLRGELLGVLTK